MTAKATPEQLETAAFVYAARESLEFYTALTHQIETGRQAIPPRHIQDIFIPAIMDDSLGHTLIVAPPGSAKTNTMIAACEWWLGDDPSLHVAYICNRHDDAVERSMVVRTVIEFDEKYRAIFPDVKPNKQMGWAQDAWYLERSVKTDKNPSFVAAGVGDAIVGRRLDRVILDDIADEDNMRTELQRKSVINYLERQLLTRFEGSRIGRAIMICTRWHEDDPAAWAISQGWHTIVLPAISDESESYWPEQRPAEKLACPDDQHRPGPCCMKKQLGSLGFAQQYMGIVVSEDSAIFRREWWQRYRVIPQKADVGGIFVDLAHEEKKSADETVIAPVCTDGVNAYWHRDLIHGRMQFPEVERAILDARARHSYPIYIEETPGSKPLIQRLSRQVKGVIPWRIEGRSKQARAEAVSPYVEAGNCFLPENAEWVGEFIDQHAQFPLAKHDDFVDTTTMCLIRFMRGGSRRQRMPANVVPFSKRWEEVSA